MAKNTHIAVKTAAVLSSLAMAFMPVTGALAISDGTIGMTGTVITQVNPNPITVNSINAVKTSGIADGTFENGWQWVFDITIPAHSETNLTAKFGNWLAGGLSGNSFPAANNIRFYSAQSSNAFNSATAIYITAPDTYSSTMLLTGNLISSSTQRRVQITVDVRIPNGTPSGFYSTNFGIKTQ